MLPVTSVAWMVRSVPTLPTDIPWTPWPITAPEEVILNAPLPSLKALIPDVLPVTSAAWMVRSVPKLRAFIPWAAWPVTAPVDVIPSASVPLLVAKIPRTAPVTPAVLMVRLSPYDELLPRIPCTVVPVTVPTDVILRSPVPLFFA